MQRLFQITILSLAITVFAGILPIPVLAQATQNTQNDSITDTLIDSLGDSQLPHAGKTREEATGRVAEVIGRILNGFISLFGVIFLALLVYGGYKWLMAAGREDEISKAKKVIQSAVIGLMVVLISFLASIYIYDILITAVS